MNYYGPRQHGTGKRWDYTCMRDDRIWPVGYCGGWRERTREALSKIVSMPDVEAILREQEEDRKNHLAKYHTKGHETAEEACACYRNYLLDHHLRLDGKFHDAKEKCAECSDWTQTFARVHGSSPIVLCESHLNRETVEKHYGPISEIISSY